MGEMSINREGLTDKAYMDLLFGFEGFFPAFIRMVRARASSSSLLRLLFRCVVKAPPGSLSTFLLGAGDFFSEDDKDRLVLRFLLPCAHDFTNF